MSQVLIEGGTIENTFFKNRVRYKVNTETLGATKTLIVTDSPVQFLDNGAAVRDVILPAEALSEGLFFFMKNTGGGANAITVKDDAAATQASILELESCICFCDGVTWECMVGAES